MIFLHTWAPLDWCFLFLDLSTLLDVVSDFFGQWLHMTERWYRVIVSALLGQGRPMYYLFFFRSDGVQKQLWYDHHHIYCRTWSRPRPYASMLSGPSSPTGMHVFPIARRRLVDELDAFSALRPDIKSAMLPHAMEDAIDIPCCCLSFFRGDWRTGDDVPPCDTDVHTEMSRLWLCRASQSSIVSRLDTFLRAGRWSKLSPLFTNDEIFWSSQKEHRCMYASYWPPLDSEIMKNSTVGTQCNQGGAWVKLLRNFTESVN